MFVVIGITAVLDKSRDLAVAAIWADGVKSGRLVGPTIFQAKPNLNEKSFNKYRFALASPETSGRWTAD
ncbi:hypothetical protein [Sphingomonas morindae]|uniref:Uncharacterized protein n=1 Tax=Sphingomonas morindae TaxID=1541170 RepID=A0ABY4X7L1_9SPHN|nr:hypothetical protein [Sphingomonas morindae]USI72880.1 hypothetical protein LHA26_16700 [Sphingomonas morindae]